MGNGTNQRRQRRRVKSSVLEVTRQLTPLQQEGEVTGMGEAERRKGGGEQGEEEAEGVGA